MSSSVLGKRTRSSTDSTPKSAKRVKGPAHEEIYHDENANPFVHRYSNQGGASVVIGKTSKARSTGAVPSKHEVTGCHISFSTKPERDNGIGNDENLNPIQNPTPQTPRHRDAFSKQTPFTPRHRVLVARKPLTPVTPRTPVTPGGSITTIYSKARQIFTRSTDPGRLVGREAEREELTTFVQCAIQKGSGGCTYISGPPGTGKSAMVDEVMNTFDESATVKKVYVNCMSIKATKDLYGILLESLGGDLDVLEGEEVKALQELFLFQKKSKTVYVVTLDEIDHILALDLESLYKLFELALQKSSRLILVGIANALDLTDRFLPRLKARNLKPELLPFLPYTAAQIKAVITTRLKSLVSANSPTPDYIPFLHPAAIELCSRKVSSQTGDLRKAFDICRRAVDIIEAETKQKHEAALRDQFLQESPSKKPLAENLNLSSTISCLKTVTTKALAQSLSTLTVETAPRASISHINKITSSTFGNGVTQRLKTLNLQQKAALCALVALEKRKREASANVMATPSKSKNSAPTIKALYDIYCMLCTRDSILHPLTGTEFRDVIGSLETLSLISEVNGKNGSFVGLSTPSKRKGKFGCGSVSGDEKRVASSVGEREVLVAVEGLGGGILKSILSGAGLD